MTNLLLDDFFSGTLNQYQASWRRALVHAIEMGVPTPAFSTALSFYDGYRTARLPANLLQAQRDFFGAHTYRARGPAARQFLHTNWTGTRRPGRFRLVQRLMPCARLGDLVVQAGPGKSFEVIHAPGARSRYYRGPCRSGAYRHATTPVEADARRPEEYVGKPESFQRIGVLLSREQDCELYRAEHGRRAGDVVLAGRVRPIT